MESIRYLRQHPKTGILHYRRVVPPQLREHVGVGTISRSLGARTLNNAALARWIEADREAEQRLSDARAMVGEKVSTTVMATVAEKDSTPASACGWCSIFWPMHCRYQGADPVARRRFESGRTPSASFHASRALRLSGRCAEWQVSWGLPRGPVDRLLRPADGLRVDSHGIARKAGLMAMVASAAGPASGNRNQT